VQLLRMIRADVIRGLRVDIRYPLNLFAEFATLTILYLGVYWANRLLPGASRNDAALASLLGFVMWYLLAVAIGALSTSLQSEAEQGILEQLFLIPVRTAELLFSRLISTLLRAGITIAVIFGVMALATGVHPVWRMGPAFLVIVISLMGLVGVGYCLAGLTLLYKRTGSLVGLVNLLFLVIIGVLNNAPAGNVALLTRILPLAYGSQLLNQVLAQAEPPAGAALALKLLGLSVNSMAYLVVGLLLFQRAHLATRRRGILSQY